MPRHSRLHQLRTPPPCSYPGKKRRNRRGIFDHTDGAAVAGAGGQTKAVEVVASVGRGDVHSGTVKLPAPLTVRAPTA